jgi:hypothetical protein
MERIGVVSRRVLASLVAANDNLRMVAGSDNGRPRLALTGEGRPPAVEGKTPASGSFGNAGGRTSLVGETDKLVGADEVG